jgi:hypothetical protein
MGDYKQASSAARLMRKAGTSALEAAPRLRETFELTEPELRSVLRAIWGVSTDTTTASSETRDGES